MNTGDLGENGIRLHQRIRNLPFPSVTCVEVGVREGVGSVIMLDATSDKGDSHVIGIEASEIPPMLKRHPRYRAIDQIDSVTALMDLKGTVHAALIDTLHCAHQAATEAFLLWTLLPVNGLLAFHDTAWPEGKRDFYCGTSWPTPREAVRWLFDDRPYCVVEHFPESWGMSFVTKTQEGSLDSRMPWDDIFDGRDMLLSVLPESVVRRRISP